jgi:hypothetical protein
MQSQHHSDLEELKQRVKMSKEGKWRESTANDPSTMQLEDVMLVLHKEELNLVEELLYDVLEKDESATSIYPNEKRLALNILKHIQSE